ncbi:type II secretion system protein [Clostridiaceae bacterium UIB06]|uniref:Type II secretion system protein n=1 Tax=Clostridium thailandense TaxID=2794346 RepID=A0A949WT01_9CLOT|nr:type II secretion system protein [Clostridium thailandense]MBV7275750.1 type II secretion system protein [Clostridium thailandense]MCH5136789.1 type II secretion system protein [Clostridiaceae bacterium UIB06]
MNLLKKKKGFTLIELMIVLAIIAILAVVLIPKSGVFKNQSKNAGVITNVNTVRAYLETKVTNDGGANSYLSSTNMATAVQGAFNLSSTNVPTGTSTSEQLINPFDNTKASILIVDETGGTTPASLPTTDPSTITVPSTGSIAGEVVIEVYTTGYRIYGLDNGKTPTQAFIIK